uniref:SRR1-like domain-containing protein n=1 Tax=Panagrolaimus sp. ES5 TaxID=591445 RepID=A0AC34G1Q9_9BILA
MENNNDDDVIYLSSDSDNDDTSMKDVTSDSASTNEQNSKFEENEDHDSAETKKCGSEFTDDDISTEDDEENEDFERDCSRLQQIMENNNEDDVIYLSSDSENDDTSMKDVTSNSASPNEQNSKFGKSDDQDSAETKKCGSEFTDDDISTEDDEEDEDFERGPVSSKDIVVAMEWAEANSPEIAEAVHSKIKRFLKNKIVIQIQMYGLRIRVLETEEFSSEHFIQALESAKHISNPAFICYMIHGMYEMYEKFLEAYWKPELLSRCIFIGNNPEKDPEIVNTKKFKRLDEYAKLCDKDSLGFKKDTLAFSSYGDTCVYSISEENAKVLINKFP